MSRFVSAGAIDAETGEVVENQRDERSGSAGAGGGGGGGHEKKKNEAWEAVQKELETERKRREEKRREAVEGGEKSLYDVLQANKAAKQAAFEEQNRIKNQFRPLDDDEIDFLDEVRESKRAEEERVRRETEEGLAAFRKAQNKRPNEAGDAEDKAEGGGEEEWSVARKRRKAKEGMFGVKREKSEEERKDVVEEKGEKKDSDGKEEEGEVAKAKASLPVALKPKLGLVSYGSDSDDD
ncbi:hypothetical protein CTRI78_v001496 [Colletotrichum trifolii]|uniref:FAM192A/Fyv6 N-terminal domain-containing protein n=1 Tax=Colletotrichum trifolii TaxID=5466 RepID=A0A4R8RP74_COLTR|nr:hypothetical protein CTRI78_v001496 [Colletotrichum trifolii]